MIWAAWFMRSLAIGALVSAIVFAQQKDASLWFVLASFVAAGFWTAADEAAAKEPK